VFSFTNTLSLELATTAERNQVMGHSRAEIFDKYYINQVVGTNTQSAYLETSSKNALINLTGHMSLTRDLRAPDSIKSSRLGAMLDPDVQELEKRRVQLRVDIVIQFGRIKAAAHIAMHEDYRTILLDLKRRNKHVKRVASDKV
jgi:hypothetical protein